ncbi:MAG: GAF domain-containing protein [Tabrizicola flagellatus]|uniref:GAF domain-containing protein n=1 Tax=Tabrizicola flagellatus TaxID=2593021 RepID=UPI00391C72DB
MPEILRQSLTWRKSGLKVTAFSQLHADCAALGTRLFTVTALDEAAAAHRRVYTSHPLEYPVQGTKPMEKDAWHAICVVARRTFVANTPAEFSEHFFDHELIVSLGLGSCANLPVVADGVVLGTVNLLAEAGHFTPERLAAYHALVGRAEPAISAALAGFGQAARSGT